MKIRNNVFLIAALCLAVFCLATCGDADGSNSNGMGTIIINFGNAGARYAVSEDEQKEMSYRVTLTNPEDGKPIPTKRIGEEKRGNGATIKLSVPEGTWNITVDATSTKEGGRIGTGKGTGKVDVTAGEAKPVPIEMKITGTRVYSWADLVEDFGELDKGKNGKLEDLEDIEIIGGEPFDASSGLSLSISKEIRLWAKNNVTIMRGINQKDQPVFTITNCTLILEGKIEINGNKNNITNGNSTRALINVMENSILRMLDGVTITNNISSSTGGYGGGIYVENGKFYMEGGVISNNRASTSGGGVYINDRNGKTNGEFEKSGGIIYGSETSVASDNKNSAETKNGGDAVYDKGTLWNETLDKGDPWPPKP